MRIEEWTKIILSTKRGKHLYDAMCDRDVVEQGADDAYDALSNKDEWFVQWWEENRTRVIDQVHKMILTKTFQKRVYHEVTIKSRDKDRQICPENFNPWSIITHTMKLVLEPIACRLLIYDASAGIPGKGQVFAARRIKRLIRRHPELKYFVDTDIRKFYMIIPHQVAIHAMEHYISDKDFIEVFTMVSMTYESHMDEIIQQEVERKKKYCRRWAENESAPRACGSKGVIIGSSISQIISNITLSVIDRKMVQQHHVKFYHRHCDDILMMAATKEEAFKLLQILNKEMNALGLCIKASAVVAPLKDERKGIQGRTIDAAGYIFSRWNMRMRKATKHRMAMKITRIKSRKRMTEVMGAYFGICKWGMCRNLWNTMLKQRKTMSFAEYGIKTEYIRKGKDGKRFFDTPETKIAELAEEQTPIVVLDFEDGVMIDEKPKLVVLFRKENDKEDIRRKFITSSERIRNKMLRARELEKENAKVFPNHTKVSRVPLRNGRYTYDIE